MSLLHYKYLKLTPVQFQNVINTLGFPITIIKTCEFLILLLFN